MLLEENVEKYIMNYEYK